MSGHREEGSGEEPRVGSPSSWDREDTQDIVFDEEERKALGRVVQAYKEYQNDSEWEIRRWEQNFHRLPDRHKALLSNQIQKFSGARQCVQMNQLFFDSMIAAFDPRINPSQPALYLRNANAAGDEMAASNHRPSAMDMDKVQYVLKNLVRDWSDEGAQERKLTYGRILAELQERFKDWPENNPPPSILIPGAGLARLCVEVAGLGYEAQGNEFSYFMLLASSFMMNHTMGAHQWRIHPWVLSTCNQLSEQDQLRATLIPDKDPVDIVTGSGLLSLCAGDFVDVYSRVHMAEKFDCVVTSCFVDTAHNILEYIEVIAHILKQGGFWINLGPLLYHWVSHQLGDSKEDDLSVEIPLEDVENAAVANGFVRLKREMVTAPYLANTRSMYQTVYRAVFWTMVKDPLAAERQHCSLPQPQAGQLAPEQESIHDSEQGAREGEDPQDGQPA